MKIKDCIEILGKLINSEEVKLFLSINGFKHPKIETITNRKLTGDRSYWVESRKNKSSILFNCTINNSEFKPFPTNKKGVFYPIATDIRFEDNFIIEDIPFGLKPNMMLHQIIETIGEPHIKSSDVAEVWINEDGMESWYQWAIPLEKNEHFYFGIRYWNSEIEPPKMEYTIFIKEEYKLFHLFDEMKYENIQTFLKSENNYRIQILMFIFWSIEKELFCDNFISNAIACDIKTGKSDILEFIQTLNKSYIAIEDFTEPTRNFIRRYIKNLNSDDIYYYRDFCNTFLKSKKLRSNYLGRDAQEELNKIAFNEKNYEKFKKVLNHRFEKIL